MRLTVDFLFQILFLLLLFVVCNFSKSFSFNDGLVRMCSSNWGHKGTLMGDAGKHIESVTKRSGEGWEGGGEYTCVFGCVCVCVWLMNQLQVSKK